MNDEITVAFDVDGTLIHQTGESEDTPKYENIALFKMLQSLGCRMIIWSGGGLHYAERWAEKLGLDAEIRSKDSFDPFTPDITFDDMPISLGKVNIKVTPR